MLDDPTLRYKPIYEVRWLSFYNAVSVVKRTLGSLLVYFEQQAIENDDAVAKGLMKQISSYSFVAITHLLYDVLGELTRLCYAIRQIFCPPKFLAINSYF